MFYQIFLSPQVKRCTIITYKHGNYGLFYASPNDLMILYNKQINFNCFFKIIPSQSRFSLNSIVTQLVLNTLFAHPLTESHEGENFDLRRKFNKLQQGTPSLILAITDCFCGTESWPLYPPQPRGCLVNSYSTEPS